MGRGEEGGSIKGDSERERETERDKETKRDRDRETDRQTDSDRQTVRRQGRYEMRE